MKEALKLALEAFEKLNSTNGYWWQEVDEETLAKIDPAITAIKAALAQPKQEPVAWMTPDQEGFRIRFSPPVNDVPLGWDALYTTPPQRKPLTDDEISKIRKELSDRGQQFDSINDFVRAIEAAHGIKEKNT